VEILADLRHPNVVELLGVCMDHPAVVTTFYHNRSLYDGACAPRAALTLGNVGCCIVPALIRALAVRVGLFGRVRRCVFACAALLRHCVKPRLRSLSS
jgi:hypothetical protein